MKHRILAGCLCAILSVTCMSGCASSPATADSGFFVKGYGVKTYTIEREQEDAGPVELPEITAGEFEDIIVEPPVFLDASESRAQAELNELARFSLDDLQQAQQEAPDVIRSGDVDHGSASAETAPADEGSSDAEAMMADGTILIQDEAMPLAAFAVPSAPSATGAYRKSNESAVIDYSNASQGYVMVQYTEQTVKRLKARVSYGGTEYTYDISYGSWAVLPLSEGSGTYSVTVYENKSGTSYRTVLSAEFTVQIASSYIPFLQSNQYVNYRSAPLTVATAASLTRGMTRAIDKAGAIYQYVIRNMAYDYVQAQTVSSGYVPNLDSVLQKRSGICFDYAALLAGMLRSQGVPCKLVVGYAGSTYHAWVNAYVEYGSGMAWVRLDPTWYSYSGDRSAAQAYIGNGAGYSARYFY